MVATDQGFLDLLTVTFLTEYRQRPMHVLGVPGVVALATGGLIGLWLTAEKILTGASIGNRPLLLLAVLLVLVGVQFFGLGLLGNSWCMVSTDTRALARAARSPICGAGEGPRSRERLTTVGWPVSEAASSREANATLNCRRAHELASPPLVQPASGGADPGDLCRGRRIGDILVVWRQGG